MDNDDTALVQARLALDKLRQAYVDARDGPNPDFDTVYALRIAYAEGGDAYAALDARLLSQAILTTNAQLQELIRINREMDEAVDNKAYLLAAARLVKLLVAIV